MTSASLTGTLSNPASNKDDAVVTLNGTAHATAAPGATASIGCTLNAGDELKMKEGGNDPSATGSGTLTNNGATTATVVKKQGRTVLETLCTAAPGASVGFSFTLDTEGHYLTVTA